MTSKTFPANLCAAVFATFITCLANAQTTFTDISAFEAATSDLTVINFDVDDEAAAISNGTVLSDEYDGIGVQFNPFNSGELRIASCCNPTSAPNVLLNRQVSFGGGGFESVFDTPSTAFGLQFGGLQADRLHTVLELFDEADSLIAAYDIQDEIGENDTFFLFFGVTTTTPIAKAQVAVGENDFVWFDDLMVGTAVPEPCGFLFSATGCVLLLTRSKGRCHGRS